MPCDSMVNAGQTLAQRKTQVREAAARVGKLLAAKKVKVTVGPQGAVEFTGLSEADRAGLTDACIYRRVMQSGSSAAKMAIMRAEQLAGRGVDRAIVAQGVHSHDGGATWHPKG